MTFKDAGCAWGTRMHACVHAHTHTHTHNGYTIRQEIFLGYKFLWFSQLPSNPQKVNAKLKLVGISHMLSFAAHTVKCIKTKFHRIYKSKPFLETDA